MEKITCVCDQTFSVEPQKEIDLDMDTDLINDILNGRFMVYKCPACGTELKLEFPVRIIQKTRNMELFFIPEKDRSAMLRDKLPYPVSGDPRYIVGYPELVEKLTIFEYGLDDKTVELLKYHLLSHALETADAEREIHIYFNGKKEGNLVFHIDGIRENELGVSRIPVETYQKAEKGLARSLSEEPLKSILSPPYISINKVYREDKP